ncbi:MAG: chorismate mutase, partial [Ilumatobacter fluminis]
MGDGSWIHRPSVSSPAAHCCRKLMGGFWQTGCDGLQPPDHAVPIGSALARSGRLRLVSDEQLDGYRSSIDNIDAALIHLLAERFKITQAVGHYK